HGEVQVRGVRRRIARRADVSDDLTARYMLPFVETARITLEVRVVVAETLGGIELVDRQSTGFTREQLRDRSVFDCMNRCVARGKDIDRFVRPAVARFAEHALERLHVCAI